MQERGSVMSLIKKIRFQEWLDILIFFFRYRPGLDKYDLVHVQLSWTVNEREESHFLERLVSWRFLRR